MNHKTKLLVGIVMTACMVVMLLPASVMAGTGSVTPQTVWSAFPDVWESDDSTSTAPVVPEWSDHTFHVGDDVDYAAFEVTDASLIYTIETRDVADWGYSPMSVGITVMDAAGTVLADNGFVGTVVGMDSYETLMFDPPEPGTYYVRVQTEWFPWMFSGIYYEDEYVGAYQLYIGSGWGYRVSGADRYETAIEISQRAYGGYDNMDLVIPNMRTVVLASGDSYADALGGGALAGSGLGSILLTESDELLPDVADEIDRITAKQFFRWDWFKFFWNFMGPGGDAPPLDELIDMNRTVFIIGGEDAISADVETAVKRLPYVSEVVRFDGENRYDTASQVASRTVYNFQSGMFGPMYTGTAFVVSGENWPDAVAAAPVANFAGGIILLSRTSSLPDETIAALGDLGVHEVVVVGGERAVGPTPYAQLESIVGTESVSRVWGMNRYETAAALAEEYPLSISENRAMLCSGESYVDALAASPLAFMSNSNILLTKKDSLHWAVKGYLESYGRPEHDMAAGIFAIGGEAVISEPCFTEWRYYSDFVH